MTAAAPRFIDTLTPEQRARILSRSDRLGLWHVLQSWLVIAAGLSLAALWPAPPAVLLAVVLVAGGQIGLAVLMHDAAHRSLFRTPWLNEKVGRYLCADPVLTSLAGYRRYHLRHHRLAGTADDPDEKLTVNYPVTPASMWRKVLRDLSGITGLKAYAFILLSYAEYYDYQLNTLLEKHPHRDRPLSHHLRALLVNLHGTLLFTAVFVGLLWALDAAWLYAVWLVAHLTFFQLFLRIRQIGDHAVVPDYLDPDPARHTRTTDARWWERLLISPHYEHYHLEHHLVASAPCYRLPLVRRILEERDAIPAASRARDYMEVLRLAVQQPAPAAPGP